MITVNEQQLNSDMAKLSNALMRYVVEVGMDAKTVVADGSRQVMEDMAKSAPPKSLSKLKQNIDKDVRGVFFALPQVKYRRQSGSGSEDMQWISSGPDFLTGVQAKHYRPQDSSSELARTYSVRRSKMGNAYVALGMRGRQHVQRLNRIVVSKSALRDFAASLKAKGGRMKASFVIGWNELRSITGKGKSPAQWVMKHVNNGAKGAVMNGLGNSERPSFTIQSNAPGCSSNFMMTMAHNAMTSRLHKIQSDFKNGYVFKRRK